MEPRRRPERCLPGRFAAHSDTIGVVTKRRLVRLLGVYVVAVALGQLAVTAGRVYDGSSNDVWLALNPRGLWVLLFSGLSDAAGVTVSVVAAGVSIALGMALATRRTSGALFVYLVLEGLLTAPAAFVFLMGWIGNMSGSHGGFGTRAELALPAAVCAVTSVAPWLGGLWLWREGTAA